MKQKKPIQIKQILWGIGIIFSLFLTCYGVFTYLDQFARCETVQKVDQKIDKAMEMMQQKQDKQMENMKQEHKKEIELMDFKLLSLELKQVEEQIYQIEKNYTSTPKDPVKKADLERFKRRREEILAEQKVLREKK
jgi:hypothetical protein